MGSSALALGPFDLIAPVARGGMAQVWKGVHRGQGVPVAIKIVTPRTQREGEFERRFADEVRAVATLDHPGIVMVLDHGALPASVNHPRLVPGSPWLAMEWASGGTLAQLNAPLPWGQVKALLLALLDALAHAHSYGVVHRDLKPANVLRATKLDVRPGIKLSDFGIAWAGEGVPGGEEDGELVVGTPSYMAPEQIRGDWRDLGPHTDLYALGCLSWWLCTGTPPFATSSPQQTMLAHLTSELPPFLSRVAVPEGFERWLRMLLEKRFTRRFQLAADAAYALSLLMDPDPIPERPLRAPRHLPPARGDGLSSELETVEDGPDGIEQTLDQTDVTFGESWRLGLDDAGLAPEIDAPRAPPMPPTWRSTVPKSPPIQLVGAGLSLYGLRAVQLAGREEERDVLWAQLAEVRRTGRARVVLIHGAAGTGKSRLVEWLCRRAQELGAAGWTKATFTPQKMLGEPLREMALDEFKLRGLSREDVEKRLRSFLVRFGPIDETEAAVLTEITSPATAADVARGTRPVRLTRPREYYMGTLNAMVRVTTHRPLITWFDDVQYGYHGLGVALQVLRSQDVRPFPCLLVLTMRNEALDEGSDEARRLEKLLDTPGVRVMALGPLPPGTHRELVRRLLFLDETLAAQVEERTGGNPLFAVQLVGSWVQDGTLEVSDRGFRLRAGAPVELPDDLHAVWSAHVERIVADFPAAALEFLELAACLGQEVRAEEWRRACDDPEGTFGNRYAGDEPLRASLVDVLLVHRLIVGSRRRWSFVHGMLRESIERTARREGRWEQHHRACATMLAARAGDPAVAERYGRHLLEAGDVNRAIEPLLHGVEHRLATVGPQAAQSLLATVDQALAARRTPAPDPRWGRLWTLDAQVSAESGDLDRALNSARHAREEAHRYGASFDVSDSGYAGWARVAIEAAATEARLLIRTRRLHEAEALLAGLQAEAARQGELLPLGMALTGRAEVARRRADHEQALAHLRAAVPVLYAAASDPVVGVAARRELAQAELAWGRSAEALGRIGEATEQYRKAMRDFDELGAPLGTAEAADRLGRLAVQRVDLTEAETLFRRALHQYEALGSERQLVCRMRLARVVLRRNPSYTWSIVERIEPHLARLEHHARIAVGYVLKLVRTALEGDWDGWDEAMMRAASERPDAAGANAWAWLALLAGEAAVAAGEPERGLMALRGASIAFHQLGEDALVQEVETLASDVQV